MKVFPIRSRSREEEGESVFVSMTDLAVSFLFIVLILLAFFATQLKPEEEVVQEEIELPDPLTVYLEEIAGAKRNLLEFIAEKIRERLPGIRITVVAVDGIIRFRSDDLFDVGKWRINNGSTAERVAHAVGDAFADTLPCYTVGVRSRFDIKCNASFAAIETIQIEGHTDNRPLSSPLQEREQMLDNRDLSARRGAETMRSMVDRYRPELMEFLNLRGQPVLSFAGYGATRPIMYEDTAESRAANRRIDIRFILQTPQNLPQVQQLREQLMGNRPNLPHASGE